ncbi:hypothetical protein ACIQ6Y_32640 [Streptomyces sp. NPDC096205]|uniref:hypothetical protein n=1 Tax=Streptomyces sp. NPDC096205 TaxID=3366081 RepID=UPI00380B9C45
MLNTAALDFHSELNHFWHALRADSVTKDVRARLDDARREHRARYSEAQMRVPDDVHAVIDGVHRRLNRIYGVLKRLGSGIPSGWDDDESLDGTHHQITGVWEQLAQMRRTMRRSLGVTQDSP